MISEFVEARTPLQLRKFIERAEAGEWARYHFGMGADSGDADTMRLSVELATTGAAHIVQQTDEPAGTPNRRFDFLICRRTRK